jgi:Spy/CpxP family protein refolding chaperone
MKKYTSLKKWLGMKKSRFAKRTVVAAGLVFLCAAPGLAQVQSGAPSPVESPQRVAPAGGSEKDTQPPDIFSGLALTDDQKAQIDQIRKDMKLRRDTVARAEKLNADQKGALLQGYLRLERDQIFKVLTPQQQKEVRKKLTALRAAEQEKKRQQQQQSPPK